MMPGALRGWVYYLAAANSLLVGQRFEFDEQAAQLGVGELGELVRFDHAANLDVVAGTARGDHADGVSEVDLCPVFVVIADAIHLDGVVREVGLQLGRDQLFFGRHLVEVGCDAGEDEAEYRQGFEHLLERQQHIDAPLRQGLSPLLPALPDTESEKSA